MSTTDISLAGLADQALALERESPAFCSILDKSAIG